MSTLASKSSLAGSSVAAIDEPVVPPGGVPLEEILRGPPLSIERLLSIALSTTRALAQLHAEGIVHRALSPRHVWVSEASGEAWLTGTVPAGRPSHDPGAAPPEVLLGTLAYMAPEQTGRLNRSVDARSDLYALGVILYELATSKRPFATTDPAELVHAHVAVEPLPPVRHRADLPDVVSRLVEKLLAKSAEARYQIAGALVADLARCLDAWRSAGRIDDFSLAEQDRLPHLQSPDRLFGRALEAELLIAAFERVAGGGAVELVLVRGWSGVGKSSLVRGLRRAIADRGAFCSGKFDARRSEVPYATLIDALTELVRQVLCLPEAELSPWRHAILAAVGPSVAVLAALLPDVELIIGRQPPPPEVAAPDAQLRLHLALAAFIGVFARPDRPLTLFIDDLQWLDASTIELVDYLVTRSDVRRLLIVGAYRDNEVGAAHPLRLSVARMVAADARVTEIELSPLGLEDTAALLGATLRDPAASLRPLAELIFQKTHGNPFFALQLVSSLAEEGLLTPSPGGWRWSLEAIRARRLTDDVATLLTTRLSRLSPCARDVLKRLACLGASADAVTLAVLSEAGPAEVAAALDEVAAAGLVEETAGSVRFTHDRVSEAAYALLPGEERATAHLDVARRLHRAHGAAVPDEAVFTLASQYNRALGLLKAGPADTIDERVRVAELDLAAARRARGATAYGSALAYATAGRELLQGTRAPHALGFALGLLEAECRLLTGDVAAAERELTAMAAEAEGSVDLAAVTCLQIDLYTLLDRSDLGVGVARAYLASVGVDWSAHPSREDLDAEYGRFQQAIDARGIDSLADLPRMTEPAVQATMDVLTRLQVPAMFSDENLGGMVLARMANLSLQYGNCDGSCFAYAWLAGFAGAHLGDAESARRLARLAVQLVDRPALGRYRARVLCLYGYLVTPWIDALSAGRPRLLAANEAARADGDVTFMSYTSNHLVTIALGTGEALDRVEAQIEEGRRLAHKARFGLVTDFFTGQLRLVRSLRGREPVFVPPPGSTETEADFEARMTREPLRAIAACWYWIRKLQAHYLTGDREAAEESAARAAELLWTSTADFEISEYHFFAALTAAALARSGAPERASSRLAAARRHHERIAAWARGCPATFAHREALVAAEIARAEGSLEEARAACDAAVRLAREGAFTHDLGLALQLSARLHARVGDERMAASSRDRAAEAYRRWGASALVERVDAPPPTPDAWTPTSLESSVERMDLATVMAVAQSVSSEIELDRLVQTVLRAAAEHAGAQRVALVLAERGELRVVAESRTGADGSQALIGDRALADVDLPIAMLRYVARTQQTVNLADPAQLALFQADPGSLGARSILCLPLLVRAALVGVLYLEHGSVSDAFTPKRIQMVRLLASQAAAALENARLYAAVKEENAERRRAEAVLAAEKDILRRIAEDEPLPEVMVALCEVARRFEPSWAVQVVLRDAGRDADPIRASSGMLPAAGASWTAPIASPTGSELGAFTFTSSAGSGGEGRAQALVDQLTQLAAFAVEHARKRDDLLGSEERFRHFADALPEVVWITDLSPERVVYCSPSFERIWGYTVAELYADPRLWTDSIHPEDRDRVNEKFGRWIHGIEATYDDVEFRIVRPDGQIRWIRDIGVVSKNRHGVPHRVGGIASDITAQKDADEAQRRAQAELAHLNRVATMGELTASIAHEVSQPLSAIVTSAGAGARWLRATPPDVAQASETLARIARDGSRATEVINRLRALFQKSDLTRETFLVADVVRDVEGFVCSDLRRRRITLEIDGSCAATAAWGSRVQIQQVLLNLVLNAIEAIESGSGADPVIQIVTTPADPGFVEIAVRDTGVGLEATTATRVFDAFFTTKPRGMGMGLSVARSIVEAHGGRIGARSDASGGCGRGATFAFTLPVAVPP